MISTPVDNEPMAHNSYDETAHQLLATVRQYMKAAEVQQVELALQLAQETCSGMSTDDEAELQMLRLIPPLEHALAVATILAQMHIDSVGVAAGIIFEAVDAER